MNTLVPVAWRALVVTRRSRGLNSVLAANGARGESLVSQRTGSYAQASSCHCLAARPLFLHLLLLPSLASALWWVYCNTHRCPCQWAMAGRPPRAMMSMVTRSITPTRHSSMTTSDFEGDPEDQCELMISIDEQMQLNQVPPA